MLYRWTLVAAIATYFIGLAICIHGPWEKLAGILNESKPPAPYHFKSLKGLSDEEITSFMSGKAARDHFQSEDAPDSNFPEKLWGADPKAAALAFAESNRTPKHREDYQLWMDSSTSLTAPAAGWLVLDTFDTQTVLRFGVGQPFLFHASTSNLGWSNNPYVDSDRHALQLIPLSEDEARFLAHSSFWLEHLRSKPVQKYSGASHISASHEGFGILTWQIDKQPQRSIEGSLWSFGGISYRWRGDYDDETSLNLTHFLLTEALPKHLGKRWEQPDLITRDFYKQPLAERLTFHEDPSKQAELAQVVLASLARHETDPWPAKALIALARCAGDVGLISTLPALENLTSKLPPPSADEAEFIGLDARFRHTYSAPKAPDERKQWERHQALQIALGKDVPSQLRRPLTQAITQLNALGRIEALRELARGNDATAMWAFPQLYRLQPEAYAEVLISRFSTEDARTRSDIFETLASLNPAATRRLRDSLNAKEQADLLLVITEFERTNDPPRAQTRIPALLDIVEKPTARTTTDDDMPVASNRGPAIELLAKLPLNPPERKRFEQVLLNELLFCRRAEGQTGPEVSEAARAVITLLEPDRFWDTLYVAASTESGYSEFNALIDGLAGLALANPESRLPQITNLLRQRLHYHKFSINILCRAALALDLRDLAPEIRHFATTGPTVPDGESTTSCKNTPDSPCPHRYHSARHVSALWQEPDADTRARMWTALFQHKYYDFTGGESVATGLRLRFREALTAAAPDLRRRLISQARSSTDIPKELSGWLATLPNER